MNTPQTGGEIAAADTNRKPVPADGYTTRDERPARREDRNHPDGDDGGYIHREIAPRDGKFSRGRLRGPSALLPLKGAQHG